MVFYKRLKFTAVLLAAFFPLTTFAWNFTGHVVVAQIAYDNLSPQARQKADQLSATVFKELPEKQQEKLNRQFGNASNFAKLAMLPDTWRTWKLKTIFKSFNANLPIIFVTQSDKSTQGWHYINSPYPNNQSCQIVQTENVVWAIEILKKAITQTNNQNEKAIETVLLEHFIGDIFQPLHNITRVNSYCEGDAGGNKFCLRTNQQGRCTKNLHSLWDSAVGYLKPHENIQQIAYELEKDYPKNQYMKSAANASNDSHTWSKANYEYAHFIYLTQPNQKPDKNYYQQGQIIAKSQLSQAGYQLATLLNQVL